MPSSATLLSRPAATTRSGLMPQQPALRPDPLWELAAAFARDPRERKLDLIVGVYRDDEGESPVMQAVHSAERALVDAAPSKQYVGLSGDARFNRAMSRLLLDDPELEARAITIQTVAGTGALRLLADLLAATGPGRTVLLGTPAYVNHPSILAAAGLRTLEYPLVADGRIDGDAMLAAVRSAAPGDVLLIQGCCHNPTGLSMPEALWDQLADALLEHGVIPFVDQAYFGLGDGLDADLAGMRRLLARVPEAVVSVSASKAWGLYSERTGCAIVLTSDDDRRAYAQTALETIARASYSQPPAHGALIVTGILSEPALSGVWRSELEGMRLRLGTLRQRLADGIAHPAAAPLREQRGMFLMLPLSRDEMATLRERYGIYGLPSGRINLAGIPSARVAEVAAAIGAVLRERG